MNESINLFKYIIRFSISYVLLLIIVATIITYLGIDSGSFSTTIVATLGAVTITSSKFVKDNKRIPNEIEKQKLIWLSFYVSLLAPLIIVIPFSLFLYDMTNIMNALKEINFLVFSIIVLVVIILDFFLIKFFYNSSFKTLFKDIK